MDHELSQLLKLHIEMRRPDYQSAYPKHVRRAMDVAYATHFRALLEFFHDGREGGRATHRDLKYRDVVGRQTPYEWGDYARGRLEDADKLAGHLSQLRPDRTSDWDNDQDWRLISPMIERLMTELPEAALTLPNTTEAMAALGASGDKAAV